MRNPKIEVIKYAKMLNSRKLSALRSGNISVRCKGGFFITPTGLKYSLLKNKDIVFVSLDGKFDKKKGIPSSEWKFHQDIYINKKKLKKKIKKKFNISNANSTQKKEKTAFPYKVAMGGWKGI